MKDVKIYDKNGNVVVQGTIPNNLKVGDTFTFEGSNGRQVAIVNRINNNHNYDQNLKTTDVGFATVHPDIYDPRNWL